MRSVALACFREVEPPLSQLRTGTTDWVTEELIGNRSLMRCRLKRGETHDAERIYLAFEHGKALTGSGSNIVDGYRMLLL
jgi:hypothetical protein